MKKLYIKPEMEIVKLDRTAPILSGSDEYEDDFALKESNKPFEV